MNNTFPLMLMPHVSIVTRGRTASAVASAAYMSHSHLVNERDGRTYNYSRSRTNERIVADLGIALPENTPERLSDRSVLWNEVEHVENRANSQLARKIMIPLPDVLTDEQGIELARELVAARVADGHIIDAVLHCHAAFPGENASEHEQLQAEQLKQHEIELGNELHRNLHLHMLEPLREVGERGFEQKSVVLYFVRDPQGHEARFTAQEFKEELERGMEWEKVYQYKDGRKLTKTQAQEQGLNPTRDRVRKQPVQTTLYINNGWNATDQLVLWRNQWRNLMNGFLERKGFDVRVSMQSYESMGIDKVPQIHEGPRVWAAERRAAEQAYKNGTVYEPVTDIRKHNIMVEKANVEIVELKCELEAVDRAIEESVLRSAGKTNGGAR